MEVVADTLEDIKGSVHYLAVDVAQLETGEWKVIELNDGNMSGLCGVNEEELWGNIKKELEN